jgi:hypothetical protein
MPHRLATLATAVARAGWSADAGGLVLWQMPMQVQVQAQALVQVQRQCPARSRPVQPMQAKGKQV